MHFKLIIELTEDTITDKIVQAARTKGATGSTVISSARGEGLKTAKTFLGLSLETQRDVTLLLVEEHLSREILETIADQADALHLLGVIAHQSGRAPEAAELIGKALQDLLFLFFGKARKTRQILLV